MPPGVRVSYRAGELRLRGAPLAGRTLILVPGPGMAAHVSAEHHLSAARGALGRVRAAARGTAQAAADRLTPGLFDNNLHMTLSQGLYD